MPLLDGVRRTIRRHDLARPATRVAVAVSGGADSVALAHLLVALRDAGDLQLAGVVHFNHQLRDQADDDERFCEALAARLSLPFVSDREDVAALARTQRRSVEDAARTARHLFFKRAAATVGADVVALGHTRDDQAETVLLRLLRGAGTRGLGGMHPRRGLAIRPLIETLRADLRGYLTAEALEYREDETNVDVRIPRNRVRHELLPLLVRRFNPSVVDALANEADLFRAQEAYLGEKALEWLGQHRRAGESVGLPIAALLAAPLALARAALHGALEEVAGTRTVSFADVEKALEVARGGIRSYQGSRLRVERIGLDLVLTGRPDGARGRWPSSAGPNLFRYSLSIPGRTQISEVGASVSAEVVPRWSGPADPLTATVQMPDVGELSVRNRRPGDRFQPLGAPGRKKLHDFLIDRKVGRGERDAVPLVVDSADRIIWVAGHAIDEAFRVKDPAQSVIILRLKGVGGSV